MSKFGSGHRNTLRWSFMVLLQMEVFGAFRVFLFDLRPFKLLCLLNEMGKTAILMMSVQICFQGHLHNLLVLTSLKFKSKLLLFQTDPPKEN